MSSFEEALANAQQDYECDILYEKLVKIMDIPDHFYLCNRMRSLSSHVKDNGEFNKIWEYIQNPQHDPYIRSVLIQNAVTSSKANNILKQVLRALVGEKVSDVNGVDLR
jgi:hypothetical protein